MFSVLLHYSVVSVFVKVWEKFPPACWWSQTIWYLSGSNKMTVILADIYVRTESNMKLIKMTKSVIRAKTAFVEVLFRWVEAGKFNSAKTVTDRPLSVIFCSNYQCWTESIISGNTASLRPYIVQFYVGCYKGTSFFDSDFIKVGICSRQLQKVRT